MKKPQESVNLKLLLPIRLHTRLKLYATIEHTTMHNAVLDLLDRYLPTTVSVPKAKEKK